MTNNNQYTLLPKQSEAWHLWQDEKTTEVGYGGAAGGGKTQLGCILALQVVSNYPGARVGIARKELKDLRLTTLKTLFEIMALYGLKSPKHYRYNQQDGTLTFWNGSEIILHYLRYEPSDPLYTRLGSHELTMGWVDESVECPDDAIDIFQSRIGRRNVLNGWTLKKFFLETFNPGKGRVYRNYWKPFKEGKLPEYRKFIRALPGDNPHLPQTYIENLERLPKTQKERLLYGNFDYDDDPTKIFDYDCVLNSFTNSFVGGGEPFITGDIGGRGKDRTVIYVWQGWRLIHTYIESISDQKKLRLKVEKLAERYKVPRKSIILDYDGIGTGIVDELGCVPFQAGSSPIDSYDMRGKPNFANLRSQCWFYLAEEIINKNRLYTNLDSVENVGQPCNVQEMIIEELDVMKEINNGGENKRRVISKGGAGESTTKPTIRKLLGRSPDFGDGIMMRAYFDLKPTPKFTVFA